MNISYFIPLLFTGLGRRRPLVTFPFTCKVRIHKREVFDSLFVEGHHKGRLPLHDCNGVVGKAIPAS